MDRLEVLALMGNVNLSSEVAKRQIINAVELIVHTVRFPTGVRKVTHISQILRGNEYKLQDLFIFDQATGKLKSTGNKPFFQAKLSHG
jgi:Flp pilus assembly CpaF family ATPase